MQLSQDSTSNLMSLKKKTGFCLFAWFILVCTFLSYFRVIFFCFILCLFFSPIDMKLSMSFIVAKVLIFLARISTSVLKGCCSHHLNWILKRVVQVLSFAHENWINKSFDYKMDKVLVVFAWRGDFGVLGGSWGGGGLWNVC